jgi:hypothetical protein
MEPERIFLLIIDKLQYVDIKDSLLLYGTFGFLLFGTVMMGKQITMTKSNSSSKHYTIFI